MVTGVERNLFADIMTYVWDFWLYKGNSPHKDLSIYSNLTIPAGEHPSVAELVADFAKALEETGHHIYCDSFFSGLPTAEALSKAKQQFTMCCQANRPTFSGPGIRRRISWQYRGLITTRSTS